MASSIPDGLEAFVESIGTFLPPYLSQFDKKKLAEALAQFPDNMDYYTLASVGDQAFQGDGWEGFLIYDFEEGETVSDLSGIILSNSCDIDIANDRDRDRNVVFAPVIKLEGCIESWRESGVSEQTIGQRYRDITRQRITDLFYLPEMPGKLPELIVSLDDVHSLPRKVFDSSVRTRVFTLNFYGFYLLLLKLSIHFTRIQEGMRREVYRLGA